MSNPRRSPDRHHRGRLRGSPPRSEVTVQALWLAVLPPLTSIRGRMMLSPPLYAPTILSTPPWASVWPGGTERPDLPVGLLGLAAAGPDLLEPHLIEPAADPFDGFAVKVGRFDFPADKIGQVSIRTRASRTGATGDRRRWRSLEKAIHAGARDIPRARDPRQAITTRRGRLIQQGLCLP